MKNLIAFCGPAGVGKTTAANRLIELGYVRMSFAAPLRDMLRALGISDYHLTDGKEQPCPILGGKTVRHALQTLGTQWGREMIDKNLWTRTAGQRIHEALLRNERVVIDDCRFNNEAEEIRIMRGTIVELTRDGVARRFDHASEAGISPLLVDKVIHAGDIDDLRKRIDALVA